MSWPLGRSAPRWTTLRFYGCPTVLSGFWIAVEPLEVLCGVDMEAAKSVTDFIAGVLCIGIGWFMEWCMGGTTDRARIEMEFLIHPNSLQTLWSEVEDGVVLLLKWGHLLPTCFACFNFYLDGGLDRIEIERHSCFIALFSRFSVQLVFNEVIRTSTCLSKR